MISLRASPHRTIHLHCQNNSHRFPLGNRFGISLGGRRKSGWEVGAPPRCQICRSPRRKIRRGSSLKVRVALATRRKEENDWNNDCINMQAGSHMIFKRSSEEVIQWRDYLVFCRHHRADKTKQHTHTHTCKWHWKEVHPRWQTCGRVNEKSVSARSIFWFTHFLFFCFSSSLLPLPQSQ